MWRNLQEQFFLTGVNIYIDLCELSYLECTKCLFWGKHKVGAYFEPKMLQIIFNLVLKGQRS